MKRKPTILLAVLHLGLTPSGSAPGKARVPKEFTAIKTAEWQAAAEERALALIPPQPENLELTTSASRMTNLQRGEKHQESVNKDLTSAAQTLESFETTMNRFFRRDPLTEGPAAANRLIDEFNSWVDSAQARILAEEKRMKTELEPIRRLEAQLDTLRKQLKQHDTSDLGKVHAYNSLVDKHNSLAKQHEVLIDEYKRKAAALTEASTVLQKEARARQEQSEASKKAALEEVDTYRQFLEKQHDLAFFSNLNGFYGSLIQKNVEANPEMQAYVNRARAIRHELGRIAINKNGLDENGMILVPATLCRREKSVYIVDTGARAVTIPPALVEALGLTDQIGEDVDISVAGGLRISGPELIIPQLSVYGMEAENVRAVVLKEPMVGVDGLLGISFLNRFSYRIEKEGWGDTKLILKALRAKN